MLLSYLSGKRGPKMQGQAARRQPPDSPGIIRVSDIEFINLTGDTEIGANSYLLRWPGGSVQLDAGLHPRKEGYAAAPLFNRLNGDAVDAIVATHAHLDHIGALPMAQRQSPDAPVLLSEATSLLGDAMLHNSVNVMSRRREDGGIQEYPLYTHRELDRAERSWLPLRIEQAYDLTGEPCPSHAEGSVEFFDAGHILGSVGCRIRCAGQTIFYSGDVNFEDQTLTPGATFPAEPVDTLILETTRGDYARPPNFQRRIEEERLLESILETLDRDGSVFIPVFALGKTQEILTLLHRFKKEGRLGPVPLYIGGLSTKVTTLYDKLASRTPRHYPGLQLLDTLAPYVVAGAEARDFSIRDRAIYALSSGMMTEKTLSNFVARKVLPNEKHSLFLVGYSDPDSPAGRLRASQPGEKIRLDEDMEAVPFRCHLKTFDFSGHAPREALLQYAERLQPRNLVLVHGDTPALRWFQENVPQRLPKTRVVIPPPGESVFL